MSIPSPFVLTFINHYHLITIVFYLKNIYFSCNWTSERNKGSVIHGHPRPKDLANPSRCQPNRRAMTMLNKLYLRRWIRRRKELKFISVETNNSESNCIANLHSGPRTETDFLVVIILTAIFRKYQLFEESVTSFYC